MSGQQSRWQNKCCSWLKIRLAVLPNVCLSFTNSTALLCSYEVPWGRWSESFWTNIGGISRFWRLYQRDRKARCREHWSCQGEFLFVLICIMYVCFNNFRIFIGHVFLRSYHPKDGKQERTTRQSKPANFAFLHRYHKSFKVAKVSSFVVLI